MFKIKDIFLTLSFWQDFVDQKAYRQTKTHTKKKYILTKTKQTKSLKKQTKINTYWVVKTQNKI